MSKRPEVRNVQTPGGSETAAEYFSTIQYSKKKPASGKLPKQTSR